MAKPNYRHAKKQKETARKARQDAKHQRKNTPDSPDSAETSDVAPPVVTADTPTESVVGTVA